MDFKKNISTWIIIVIVVAMLASVFAEKQTKQETSKEVPFSEIARMAEDGKLTSVTIKDKIIVATKDDGTEVEAFRVEDEGLMKTLREKKVEIKGAPAEEKKNSFGDYLIYLLPVLLIIAFWTYMLKGAGNVNNKAMGFGKAKPKTAGEAKDKVTFADVAGIEEAKEEVVEIVDYLKEPEKFQRLGGKIPKGILMVGSPGTGKTLLARAIAGEAGVPFLSISGSDFVEMFVGVGASRVRSLFEQAKKQAPCIVFIDEIDAVGRHRGAGLGGGNDEREQTLNQLLVEMDGFDTNSGVIMIAATNRPDILDPALLRPGRFDRQVVVPLPDREGRQKILEVHSKKLQLSENVDLPRMAKGTPGFSGADLANLVNEAALIAARKNRRYVTQNDFEYARDKIAMGPERRSRIMTKEERRNTAYHEAGHAICALYTPGATPIHKATIVPRGHALGYVEYHPEQEKFSITKEELEAQMVNAFGGRVAEELTFGKKNVTAGASSDLKKATSIARRMVSEWGMDDEVGVVVYEEPEGDVFLGYQIAKRKNISDKTAEKVDAAIKRVIDTQYQKAVKILKERKTELKNLAEGLLEYETLTGEEVKDVIKGKKLKRTFAEPKKKGKRSSLPMMSVSEEKPKQGKSEKKTVKKKGKKNAGA